MKLNLDYLVECIWEHLDLIRVITKKPGCGPDFDDAIVLRNGVTVKHVCHAIHRSIPELLRYAIVWVRTLTYNKSVSAFKVFKSKYHSLPTIFAIRLQSLLIFREQAQNTRHRG